MAKAQGKGKGWEMTIAEIYEELMGRQLTFQSDPSIPPLKTNPIERVLIDGDLVEVYVSSDRLLPFSLRKAEELLTRGKTHTFMGEFKLLPRNV